MTKNEDIAKALKTRLSELTRHLAEIDSERANHCLRIPRSGQLTSKIRMHSRASKILKCRKSIRFKGH
jgi:hypothetical protein